MSMDSGQGSLYTPRRAQKCLFASSNSNSYKKSIVQDLNRSRDEAFSGDESDLGPMSPLALTDRSPSSDSSSGREFVSPFATPEKLCRSNSMPMTWDRLTSRRCIEERISPFSSLKKITKAARYSPKYKSFNSNLLRSLPSSPSKVTEPSTPQRLKMNSTADEIVPETPPRSFATELQNQTIMETPRKSYSPRQITPLKSITKTAPLPKLHRRKSFSTFETNQTSSPEIKENVLKRRAPHDQITNPAKLFKADDTFAPRARAALFQDSKNESSNSKAFSLSTKTFYSSSSRTERPFAFGSFRNNDVKKRRSLPPQSSRRSIRKKQRLGKMNAGVFHGIKKRRPKINPETLKKEGQNAAPSNKNPSIEVVQPINMIAERASTPEVDENKQFFKTIKPSRATVTLNNKIKLKVADGKLVLKQKRISSTTNARKQRPRAVDISLDATDLTVDEPEVEATLEKDKIVNNLLKILEDDWADDYDTMGTLDMFRTKVSPLKPVAIIPTDEIMSPATELSNMTSTMNIKDVVSLTNIESLSLDNTNSNNETAKTGEKEKYFPLFAKGYSAPDNIFEETNNAKSSKAKRNTQWQLSAKGGGAEDQYQLDAGQKRFGATQCPECNIIYQLGDPEDENAHLNYHNSIRTLKFQGWKNERVIMEDPFTSSRIILIEPHDPKQHWKKVSEILTVVDRDLGLADMNTLDYKGKKVFLYIREKSVLGILMTEPIKTAYRMIPELIELNCCTAESTPTKCGINVIWTTMSHRRQGIATKLLDTLRTEYFYGYVMSLDDIAFSIPTPSGKIFAEKYTKTQNYKVYN
ncbi:N-acetyltransferase ESCO2 [Linepithema humile]|uniref:N-acetyltransferase ESCO2 n=1 Tax=Linepithema humile TaxID=83485 RepID=UPI0006233237|nr:PREDICTED: N-acetyltransferase ESCO1 [Linepithema humile]XP_012217574.1 PREDICTED: N-acetyltransferase ESCO1 [Linepithema humile]XP_012217575.1 PREDICTED: N-acetyltransferase ESCO1 [Linepithema humile]